MIIECHLRSYRGDRTLQELADRAGVSKGQLSQIEQGRSLPRDRDVPNLEQVYGKPRSDWYPPEVAAVITAEGNGARALVSEVWMPRSGRFRRYPLEVKQFRSWDARIVYSKGHHAPGVFGEAAGLVGTQSLRVRHEWWATRQFGAGAGGELSYHHPVVATASGAYPVTVIDL